MCYDPTMIRFRARTRVFLAASLATILVSGCNRSSDPASDPGPAVLPTKPPVALPAAEPPLDRAELLLAVIEAASLAASGRDAGASQRALDGKLFEMRMRFGCESLDGTSGSGPRGSWSFDEERRVLRIRFSPDLDGTDPVIAKLASEEVEAVEGFRVLRPWLLPAACPVSPPPSPSEADATKAAKGTKSTQAATAKASDAASDRATSADMKPEWSPPFVGIAQFFTKMDARTHRRDSRAYEVTKTLPADVQPSASGYDLVLSGRLKRLPGGQVITCTVMSRDVPPSCLISADFDNVAITRADTGEQLARWSTG